jgi:hypothetical protein
MTSKRRSSVGRAHKDNYKQTYHVGFEVSTAVVMKSIIFWDMTPRSLLSCNRRFGGTYRLHLQGLRNCLLVFVELISSTLKTEAMWSSHTSVATQQNTRRHIPEDDTLQADLIAEVSSSASGFCSGIVQSESLTGHYLVDFLSPFRKIPR